jgi:hypothetical protein
MTITRLRYVIIPGILILIGTIVIKMSSKIQNTSDQHYHFATDITALTAALSGRCDARAGREQQPGQLISNPNDPSCTGLARALAGDWFETASEASEQSTPFS